MVQSVPNLPNRAWMLPETAAPMRVTFGDHHLAESGFRGGTGEQLSLQD